MTEIRAATPADAVTMADIEAQAGDTRWSLDAVRGTLALPTTRAFVAAAPADLLGHAIASAAGGSGELLTIAVRPGHRRHGIGQGLLAACAHAWREDGVEEAFLEVRADNAGARALYAHAGWTEAGRRPGYYAGGQDAVVLRWVP